MNESQWRDAAAHIAGMQMAPLEQFIPDQAPPHVRYRCFGSGDVDIDRVGYAYDFVLNKRHRAERPSAALLGDAYVTERPFLQMVGDSDDVSAAQLRTLRYLKQMRLATDGEHTALHNNNTTHSNPITNHSDAVARPYDATGVPLSLEAALRAVSADLKVGVPVSLACRQELMRIAIVEGKYSTALAVAEGTVPQGQCATDRKPRAATLVRLIEGLLVPLSAAMGSGSHPSCDRTGSSSSHEAVACSELLKQSTLYSKLAAGMPGPVSVDGHSAHTPCLPFAVVFGGLLADLERLLAGAKAVLRVTSMLPPTEYGRLGGYATDVYAALLVQLYRLHEAAVEEAHAANGLGMGVGGYGGTIVLPAPVSPTASIWVASTLMPTLNALHQLITSQRETSCGEELVHAMALLLSLVGLGAHLENSRRFGDGSEAGILEILRSTAASVGIHLARARSAVAKGFSAATADALRMFVILYKVNMEQLLIVSQAASNVREARDLPFVVWQGISQLMGSHSCVGALSKYIGTEAVVRIASKWVSTVNISSGEQQIVDLVCSTLVLLREAVGTVEGLGPHGSVLFRAAGDVLAVLPPSHDELPALSRALRKPKRATPRATMGEVLITWLAELLGQGNTAPPLTAVDVVALMDGVAMEGCSELLLVGVTTLTTLGERLMKEASDQLDGRAILGSVTKALVGCKRDTVACEGLSVVLQRAHGAYTRNAMVNTPLPAQGMAPITATDAEAVLRYATLNIVTNMQTTGEDVVIQALSPRDVGGVGLTSATPQANTFYMMFIDHTALDVLSATNQGLPPASVTMSTEVNAFASLMARYTSAGGVLLCVTPSVLAACSPLSVRMLCQWWRNRVSWLGMLPLDILASPISGGNGVSKEACSCKPDGVSDAGVADLAVTAALATVMKRGGCLKTAIVTAVPLYHGGLLRSSVAIEGERPTCINITELLSKLVKK